MNTAQATRALQTGQPDKAIQLLAPAFKRIRQQPNFPEYASLFAQALVQRPMLLSAAAQLALPDQEDSTLKLAAALLPYAVDSLPQLVVAQCGTEAITHFLSKLRAEAAQAMDQQKWSEAFDRSVSAILLAETLQSGSAGRDRWIIIVCLWNMNRRDEAATQYRQTILNGEPAELPASLREYEPLLNAEDHLNCHQPDVAVEILNQAIGSASVDWAVRYREEKARALRQGDHLEEAAAEWESLAQFKEIAENALQNAADTYRTLRQFDNSIRCLRALRALPDSDPAATQARLVSSYTQEGLCEYALGNSEAELDCYAHALDLISPEKSTLFIRLQLYCADTEYRIGRTADGAMHYHNALALFAHNPSNPERIAQIECDWADHLREYAHDLPEAAVHYTHAITHYRKCMRNHTDVRRPLAAAYNGRGICHFYQKNYRGQISDATAAITLLCDLSDPNADELMHLSTFLRNRGDSYEQLKQYAAAGKDYQAALAVYQQAAKQDAELAKSSEQPELLLCCGRMSDHLAQYDQSCVWYGDALMLLENQEPTENNNEMAAIAALRRGDAFMRSETRAFSRALADFNQALAYTDALPAPASNPLRSVILRQRGELYAAMGQYELATQDFSAADQLDSMSKEMAKT